MLQSVIVPYPCISLWNCMWINSRYFIKFTVIIFKSAWTEGYSFSFIHNYIDNPFWKVISSNSIKSPIGTNETIIIQYAHNSEGHGNNGMNLSIALEVQPQNSQPYFRFQNLMSDPNQYLYNYTFTLGKNDRAEFVFQGTS